MKPSPDAARMLDDLAREVFERLVREDESVVVDDPLGYIRRAAGEVEKEWCQRMRFRPGELRGDSGSAIDCVPPPGLIEAAVKRLPPRPRELLLLQIGESLTYLQVAQRTGLKPAVVLHELTCAYSQLMLAFLVELGGQALADSVER